MKYLWLLLLLTIGCGPTVEIPPVGTYRPELCAVVGVSLADDYSPQPTPAPKPTPTPGPLPTPGQTCPNCNGTGKVGDGRIAIECPVCDGTGKVTTLELAEKLRKELVEHIRFLKKERDALIEQNKRREAEPATVPPTTVVPPPETPEINFAVNPVRPAFPKIVLPPIRVVKKKPSNPTEGCTIDAKGNMVCPVPADNGGASKIDWLISPTEAIAAAKAQNKPVLVHFYKDDCPWCNELDDGPLSDSEVVAYIAENVIALKLHVDRLKTVSDYDREHWQVRSVPSEKMVDSSWKYIRHLDRTYETAPYLRGLKAGVEWAKKAGTEDLLKRTRAAISPPARQVIYEQPPPPMYSSPPGGMWGGGGYGGCSSGNCGGGGGCSSGRCGGW